MSILTIFLLFINIYHLEKRKKKKKREVNGSREGIGQISRWEMEKKGKGRCVCAYE